MAIIPVRDHGENPLALRSFRGSTLIDATIAQLKQSSNVRKIVVSTNSEPLAEYVNACCTDVDLHFRANPELIDGSIENAIDDLIDKKPEVLSDCEVITVLNYEYPFRSRHLIEQSVDILQVFDAESSMSVRSVDLNLYRNSGGGLLPDSLNTNLRQGGRLGTLSGGDPFGESFFLP